MYRFIVVGVCIWALFFGGIKVEAAGKKHSHRRPPIKTLTPAGTLCQYGGKIVAAIVADRDALVPLETTVARLHIILGHDLSFLSERERASITQQMANLARLLYNTSTFSPSTARFYFEVGCLNPDFAIVPTTPMLR